MMRFTFVMITLCLITTSQLFPQDSALQRPTGEDPFPELRQAEEEIRSSAAEIPLAGDYIPEDALQADDFPLDRPGEPWEQWEVVEQGPVEGPFGPAWTRYRVPLDWPEDFPPAGDIRMVLHTRHFRGTMSIGTSKGRMGPPRLMGRTGDPTGVRTNRGTDPPPGRYLSPPGSDKWNHLGPDEYRHTIGPGGVHEYRHYWIERVE